MAATAAAATVQRRPYSFELAAERSLTPLHDRRVLDAIYKHQNPARCDTAKYLVHSLAHQRAEKDAARPERGLRRQLHAFRRSVLRRVVG